MLMIITDLLEKKDYTSIKAMLSAKNGADIAELLGELTDAEMTVVFRLLPKEQAAEVFSYMQSDDKAKLIDAFTNKELAAVIAELYIDDTVDLVEEMPANVVKRILANTDADTRKEINMILNYPADSAGSIMTTEYVTLRESMTSEQAIENLRTSGVDKETIYTCYVTKDRKLIGVVTVRDLLVADRNALISDIMETNVISVSVYDKSIDAARMFDKYDFLAIPAVDAENRLVGIVTVDDAIDVIRESDSDDIAVMAAVTPAAKGKTYLKTGVFTLVLQRIPWLLVLMLSSALTGGIITSFEASLGAMPILTAYIPMLMNTGGNAGGQSSATIVRGLALDEISGRDIFRILWKEARISVICGIVLSVVNFGKMMLVDKMLLGNDDITVSVALAVCLTLVVTVTIAKIVGCSLPIGAKKLGLDPAVMASPFITTIVDALALVTYFNIAVHLIEGM
ncbi:MAG: magnesium transporter [Ruminococcaceae bacterium]|nr:magnesium transporter [Oscillospiraceae bacterium]